ncbi:MAG: glycoside hydrolase family 130 protein [Candidatus Coatesbacteria bacterium]
MANETVFTRYAGNPIITSRAVPGSNSIFNSAVVPFRDRFAGVFRVDTQAGNSEIHAGFSRDGISWDINPGRVTMTGWLPDSGTSGFGYDPRVTQMGRDYYVTWCYYPAAGPCIGLGVTRDFKRFRQICPVMLPYNRNAVLFPRKIRGKFATLHRPSDKGHTPFGDIYYAESPDLIHWGNHRAVMQATGYWQGTKIGAGPAPIEIADGWLLIYHGVRQTCSGMVYCAFGAILDRERPWKVKYRTAPYLLAPTELYEIAGDVPNVVFPNAAILDEKTGELAMYYGAADTVVGLAHARLRDLVSFIKKNSM